MTRWRHIVAGLLALCASPASAVECQNITHADISFTLCSVDAQAEQIALFLDAPDGQRFGHFSALSQHLEQTGKRLAFAMNAGMYHPNRAPVGHYVENGQQRMRVVDSAGPGNFGMLPNGIFCMGNGRADVIETLEFQRSAPACRYATQSGPMLVINGALHPRFLENSTWRNIRNGVGTSADGRWAHFVISNGIVTFYEMATLFRDVLKTPNALYFDGTISRLHAPALGRSDIGFRMGPIVGVVE